MSVSLGILTCLYLGEMGRPFAFFSVPLPSSPLLTFRFPENASSLKKANFNCFLPVFPPPVVPASSQPAPKFLLTQHSSWPVPAPTLTNISIYLNAKGVPKGSAALFPPMFRIRWLENIARSSGTPAYRHFANSRRTHH